jgi:hypothetical protein
MRHPVNSPKCGPCGSGTMIRAFEQAHAPDCSTTSLSDALSEPVMCKRACWTARSARAPDHTNGNAGSRN